MEKNRLKKNGKKNFNGRKIEKKFKVPTTMFCMINFGAISFIQIFH